MRYVINENNKKNSDNINLEEIPLKMETANRNLVLIWFCAIYHSFTCGTDS